jgi:creatinine amidohydrolase
MRWENLTSLDFRRAVTDCDGVGLIPIGVLEPHGPHLPLGTDMFECHAVACRAAEVEPVIIFPPYPFGINHESGHLPGSFVLRRKLVFALLENVCDEMGRHGLTKIILFSGHGGNRFFIPLFVQTLIEQEKTYLVYNASVESGDEIEALLETDETGHAGEKETSTALYLHPELVKMGEVPKNPFSSLRRNEQMRQAGAYTSVDWYAMYPAMYVGDASKASADKGEVEVRGRIQGLVKLIRAVKADTMTPGLLRQFIQGQNNPTVPDAWS